MDCLILDYHKIARGLFHFIIKPYHFKQLYDLYVYFILNNRNYLLNLDFMHSKLC